jgi:hypothetical protein
MALTIIIEGQANLGVTTGMPASINVQMGVPGAAATVNVGTTTTGNPGTNAAVTNSGSESAAIFNFTIPRGDKGDQGNAGTPGTPGTPGSAATVNVGTTTTGTAGSSASVINSGSTSAAVFNFTIPRGDKGEQGNAGPGVATGGTIGQVLAKVDSSNYSTNWVNPSVAWGNITGGISAQTDLNDALLDKLSLYGGTMMAPINFSVDVNGNDLAIGAWGLGVENTNSNFAIIEPNAIQISGLKENYFDPPTNTPSIVQITHEGISKSWQSIPGNNPTSFSLTSGGFSGNQDGGDETFNFGYGGANGGNNGSSQNWNISPTGAIGNSHIKDSYWGIGDDGIKFALDGSVQLTAGLPLTGGTMNDGANVELYKSVSDANPTASPHLTVRSEGTIDGNYRNNFTDISADGINLQGDGDNFFQTLITSYEGFKHTSVNGGVIIVNGESGITFQDSSVQSTAFPGYAGTSSQYIRGDGSLNTFPTIPVFPPTGGTTSQYIRGDGSVATYGPLGDRYLTSSTSTLTCDSGNGKTMTVGTGLSYSRQQDITVSYNTANHMHGTVLTYDSATGVMTFDSNTHSGGGTYSSWEVNVGGVAGAVLPVGGTSGQVLAKINSTNFNTEWVSLGSASTLASSSILLVANNLSELTATASTARTNLGLGTMATATATDYLTKAGNLSGLTSTATSRSNLGLGAVATDAYATTAQAEGMTSTTAVINPARLRDALFTSAITRPNTSTWLTATSGTGGVNDNNTWDQRRLQGPTSASNTYVRCDHAVFPSRGRHWASNIDWTRYNALSFRIVQSANNADANSNFRAVLGEAQGVNIGDPTVRSIGVKLNSGQNIKIITHDGTTLTTYTTSYAVSNLYQSNTDILLISDGSGTVTCYVNGNSVGSTTGGPTTFNSGFNSQNCINYRIDNTSTPSGNQLSIIISNTTAFTGN